MATSGLETIPEEAVRVESELMAYRGGRWELETDPIKLKLWRSYAKSTHTKIRERIAVSHRSSLYTLESLRIQLFREYEDVKQRQERFLKFSA